MLIALLLFSVSVPMRAQNLWDRPNTQLFSQQNYFGLPGTQLWGWLSDLPIASQQLTIPSIPIGLLGWQKITGEKRNFSGVPDGILGPNGAVSDRENSYAWSAEFHGGYLYVGTTRDVIGLVVLMAGLDPSLLPDDVPTVTDLRGRIYRMKLSTGKWETFFDQTAPSTGIDMGYRYMKTYTAPRAKPVLYVGSSGLRSPSRLLAIDSQHNQPEAIFSAPGFSIRAIVEHNRQLFWASEVNGYPKIWYGTDPLKEYHQNNDVEFASIEVPGNWFRADKGAEILDMVSWNNAIYVFFCNHDFADGGFWCAKLRQNRQGAWNWELIVGDQVTLHARYPKGMGRMENGGATPYVFKNKMYVGTISNTMWGFLMAGIYPDFNNLPATGIQIFRFDKNDRWERVMPSPLATGTMETALNGFANPLNLYLWRFVENDGKLYAGTFDARTALAGLGLQDDLNLWNPAGFDLYCTEDGKAWFPVSLDGFGDPFNYGVRVLKTNPDNGDLYLGTANPFYGCQVWRKRAW